MLDLHVVDRPPVDPLAGRDARLGRVADQGAAVDERYQSYNIELAAVSRVAAFALAPASEVLSSATATASGRLRSTGRVYASVR